MDLATVDKLLTTTRSVRNRLDLTRPVDPEVLQQCLEIATQAPIGGNNCRYHFVVITDPTKRAGLAELYRKAMGHRFSPSQPVGDPKMWASAWYLAEHLHEVPVHILSCVEYTSVWKGENQRAAAMTHILPVTWSLMLALRSRGIGSAFTTIHTHYYEREAAALLGIPEHIIQAALLPVAYYTGDDFQACQTGPGTRTDALGDLGKDALGTLGRTLDELPLHPSIGPRPNRARALAVIGEACSQASAGGRRDSAAT